MVYKKSNKTQIETQICSKLTIRKKVRHFEDN